VECRLPFAERAAAANGFRSYDVSMRNRGTKSVAKPSAIGKMAQTLNVRALERKAIDDVFRDMAHDKSYQSQALLIAERFAASDAEAMELCERDLFGA
jgi:hypothetical protein